jgi:hypothetical protein
MPDMNIPYAGIGRASKRARLGVRLAPVAPIVTDQLGLEPGKGVAIVDVLNGSAAEKAGFKVYDIVMEFAGKPVTGPADFAHQVNAAKAGEKVDAVVMRKGKRVELKGVELPALPRDPMGLPMNPKATDNAQPGAADSVSVSVSNGMFTIKAMQDGVSYLITGQAGADGAAVEKVSIKTGNDSVEANGVAKVPQKYRPTVEKLLKLVGKPRTKVID